MVVKEVFEDVDEGETDDWHRYPLRWEIGGTRQYGVYTPDVSYEDSVVCAVGVLPLEWFGYQSGKTQSGGEFPVSKVVEDLGNDFYRKVWS